MNVSRQDTTELLERAAGVRERAEEVQERARAKVESIRQAQQESDARVQPALATLRELGLLSPAE
jgi:hypothetical protein